MLALIEISQYSFSTGEVLDRLQVQVDRLRTEDKNRTVIGVLIVFRPS